MFCAEGLGTRADVRGPFDLLFSLPAVSFLHLKKIPGIDLKKTMKILFVLY